jgi:hypothetical protein
MKLLREYIHLLLSEGAREYSPEFVKAINDYVRDSRTMSYGSRKIVHDWVSQSTLPPGLKLQRISSKDPNYSVGDSISFPLASFTMVDVTSGKSAGQISWKSSDACIMQLKDPKTGWVIDYDVISVAFDAAAEREVIVTGNYVVVDKQMIVEPGTAPQYGYEIPLYILEER